MGWVSPILKLRLTVTYAAGNESATEYECAELLGREQMISGDQCRAHTENPGMAEVSEKTLISRRCLVKHSDVGKSVLSKCNLLDPSFLFRIHIPHYVAVCMSTAAVGAKSNRLLFMASPVHVKVL